MFYFQTNNFSLFQRSQSTPTSPSPKAPCPYLLIGYKDLIVYFVLPNEKSINILAPPVGDPPLRPSSTTNTLILAAQPHRQFNYLRFKDIFVCSNCERGQEDHGEL